MADRNAPASFTFEEWRVEFNELSVDVGDITGITGASGIIASATDVVEAITLLNTAVNNTDLDFTADGGSAGSVSENESLDFQGTANQITTASDGNNQVTFALANTVNIVTGISNSGMTGTLTFPTIGGVISTEGFGIALAVALG
jgi:hypothetical protein|tara:strand:+ start:1801 stop:2235 length:435 start_codon:yes stop_codon:yes gene_type:complete